jgi:spore germination cell wall hydrolase CwlJ-like protein
VNPELRLLAVCAALILPQLSLSASDDAPITVRFSPMPARIAHPDGPVSFSIPKYALTSTERETVAACLILEAANQGDFGMRSVMSVIRNRARGQPELFATTVLRPKQFSALNQLTAGRETLARVIARARRDMMWSTALKIVDASVQEAWHDPTGGATHYTRTGERTPWTRSLAKTVTIGSHSFYR